MKICYLNGKFLPENKAAINLADLGLLRSYGVFDSLRTYNGKVFLFDEHLVRLKNSAKAINLKIPATDIEIKKIIKKLLSKNKYKESNIRIVLTGGSEEKHTGKFSPTFYILVSKLEKLPGHVYSRGIKIITHNYKRDFPRAKTTNYLTSLTLKGLQKQKNAFEILYTYEGCVLEATTSNFFVIKNNKLITPQQNILFGTTRNLVIKLSKKHFDIEERDLSVEELKGISEAFITATNKEIIPVVNIDGKRVGNGSVGPNTKKIMGIFRNYVTSLN